MDRVEGVFVKGVCLGVALLVAVSACKGSSTAPGTDDFAIAVTSPSSDLFLGASQQMTATASNGRTLAGTWGTDNAAVATVTELGVVTAVSSGQANIFFIAEGRQGTTLIRALPNLAGNFTGNYRITSCAATGQMGAADVCSNAPPGSLVPYTFVLGQTGAVLTGRVIILGVEAIPAFAATIGVAGDVSVTGNVTAPGGFTVNTTWQIAQRAAGVTTGTIAQVWTAPGLTGQTNVAGSINTITKTATAGQ
jgi:hypothetical protein